MKRHFFLFLITLLLLFCFLSGLQEQQKLFPPEKHEVVVRLVLVDVIVTKGGEFVTDLTMEDFELYEDEVEVPINSFDLISFGKRELIALEEKPEEGISPVVPRKQLVVVFDGASSWQRNLKKGARKIVDELVSLAKLGNEVMIIQLSENRGIEVLQPFTIEEELIRKALIKASANVWYESSLDALKMYQEVGIEDVGAMAQVERYLEVSETTLEQEYLFIERRRFEKAVGGILTVANMIKDLSGRKSILLISDGFPDLSSKTLDSIITETTPTGIVSKARSPQLDIRRDAGIARVFDPFNILEKEKIMSGEEVLQELIRFANAQNISIYALDPENFTKYLILTTAELGPEKDMKRYVTLRENEKIKRVQNLSWLSEDTGGVSLRGAKRYDRFHKVMSTDLNYYYQLSYYPPRKEPDNKYHKIAVKVKGSGMDVRFRKGYTDYTEEEEEKIRLVSAFYNPSIFKDLPFEAEFMLIHKDSKKYEPWMNIAIPSKKLFMERKVTYGLKNFNFHVWIKEKQRGEGTFAGQFTIPISIDESFMDVIKTIDYLCFHFKGAEIPFKQNEYQAIFALRDDQTNEIGTWEATISLPDFKKEERGSIINCVLGLLSPSPKKGKQSFSISQRDGSLEYGEIKFFPSIVNQFQRMQDASIFLQVFAPQGKVEISPEFEISGEGRLTQPLPAELVAESWNNKSKVWSGIFNLDLRTVIFGVYTLKVEIPVSEEGPALTKEVELIKLRY